LIDSPADDPVHFQQLVDRHVFNAHGLQIPAGLSVGMARIHQGSQRLVREPQFPELWR